MAEILRLQMPARRVQLQNGGKAVRVRDNRRAPRYKIGEWVLFSERGGITGRAARGTVEGWLKRGLAW